jgi:hypothetical protein
MHSEKRE